MSGIIDTVGSKSGIVGSDVYPAGHVIKQSFFGEVDADAITITSDAYTDTAMEVSHTTHLSSTDSYLIYDLALTMTLQEASGGARADVTMRTVSNSTYTEAESIAPSANDYGIWYSNYQAINHYIPRQARLFCGLVSGMAMPATKSTWSAGDVLYFRLYAKSPSNGTNYSIVHTKSSWNMSVTEVAR